MFKNYLTLAFRNFKHNKVFSLINVVGLSIGISAALVIFLIVQYHFSFDKFEKDRDRMYRIVSDFKFSGETIHNSGVPDPLSNAVRNEITGIASTISFHQPNMDMRASVPSATAKTPAVFKHQSGIIFADGEYFKAITYQWLAGAANTALKEPYKVVLAEDRAKAYFPALSFAAMIGKEVVYNDSVKCTVTGIVKVPEQNSDFSFKEFVSEATIRTGNIKDNYQWTEWGGTSSGTQLYIKLSNGTTVPQVEKQLAGLMKKYNKDQKFDDKNYAAFKLQPLSDLHFNSDYGSYDKAQAHKPTLYGLLLVAVFLLLLGCINFINLTTAQASQRAKEIGIRKTLGSSRPQLIRQFLSETFFITIIATILSIAITPLLLKVFAGFIPTDLHFNVLHQPYLILFLVGLVLVVGLLSGFYPALVLSSYNPALVLKNQSFNSSGTSRKLWLRKTLTVSQFIIAQIFIMATLIVSKQIHFTLNKDLGFKKDAIVFFNTPWTDRSAGHKQALIHKLNSLPGIAMLSLSGTTPSSNSTWSSSMKFKDGKKEKENDVQLKYGDTNYLKLYHIKLLAGTELPYSDTVKDILINETYAHILGFQQPQQAIGKYLEWNNRQHAILGVVADFHQRSLHEPIKPAAIASNAANESVISIALQPQNAAGTLWTTTITKIKSAYKETYPDDDFDYEFLDETIAKFYKSEQDISSLLKWATGLAVFISCLGLLGLVIYTTNQRRKEIGVRKVLGASITQIVSILSKDFVGLVVIAFAIATPVAWWATYKWLQNFAYKTTLSWWVFLLSGVLMVIVALITLSIQTIRAASLNPVKSLRSE